MEIKVKQLRPEGHLPTWGSDAAAGADLYAAEDAVIYAFTTAVVSSGIALELPNHVYAHAMSRSGHFAKRGLLVTGVVDPDYRGELGIMVANLGGDAQSIKAGERVGQLVLLPRLRCVTPMEFVWAEDLGATERGDGGFGSTGR